MSQLVGSIAVLSFVLFLKKVPPVGTYAGSGNFDDS
jgi:hypothetical protein